MIFSSIDFVIFFLVFVSFYKLIGNHIAAHKLFVFFGSFFFYAFNNVVHSIIIIYLCLCAVAGGKTRLGLPIAILACLVPLVYYKYSYFFFVDLLGLQSLSPLLIYSGPIPVGISFVTFSVIAYIVDVRSGRFNESHSAADIFNYVFFFPQLVAGPILRPAELLPMMKKPFLLLGKNIKFGLFVFTVGILKKVFIADSIGELIDPVFADVASSSTNEVITSFFLFPFQIYFDFSGYTDMAIGLALIFGVRLPDNFLQPYLSYSLTEFWRRWHVTLSNWIRDYIYIPLGGSRVSESRTYSHVLMAMSISGLWHGANFNFVLWGFLNGCVLAMERFFKITNMTKPINLGVTLFLIFNLWVVFRVESLTDLGFYYEKLFAWNDVHIDWRTTLLLPITALMILAQRLEDKKRWEILVTAWNGVLVCTCCVIVIFFSLVVASGSSAKFIYFDF